MHAAKTVSRRTHIEEEPQKAEANLRTPWNLFRKAPEFSKRARRTAR